MVLVRGCLWVLASVHHVFPAPQTIPIFLPNNSRCSSRPRPGEANAFPLGQRQLCGAEDWMATSEGGGGAEAFIVLLRAGLTEFRQQDIYIRDFDVPSLTRPPHSAVWRRLKPGRKSPAALPQTPTNMIGPVARWAIGPLDHCTIGPWSHSLRETYGPGDSDDEGLGWQSRKESMTRRASTSRLRPPTGAKAPWCWGLPGTARDC